MRPLLAILALLLAAPAARADPGTVIVTTNGKVADRDRALAMGAAETRLRAAGWEFVAKPLTPREVQAVTACLHNVEAWPCVSKVVAGRGIRRLAAVALRRDQALSGTPELVITGRLVLDDVEQVVIGTRFCPQCTDDTLGEVTTELTTALLQQAQLDAGRTVLSIKSTPQGAMYTVDGTLTSATDALITVVPGTHVVTIERDGYHTETRTVDAAEGKTAEVMVTLRKLELPEAAGAVSDGRREVPRRSRALPITLVATGSAAVLGGLIALPFNQRNQGSPADQKQPRWGYDTLTPGLAAIASGAVIAGVGGYLWWRATRAESASSAAVAPVPGGAALVVRGSF